MVTTTTRTRLYSYLLIVRHAHPMTHDLLLAPAKFLSIDLHVKARMEMLETVFNKVT